MRSRKHAPDQVAEVARRRLELLSAELAGLRAGPDGTPVASGPRGSGELLEPVQEARLEPRAPVEPRARLEPGAPVEPGRHAHRPVDAGTAWGGWVQDRLPAPLQGRVRVGVGHLALLALLVAGAVGVAAWWALQAAGPSERTVPTSATPASPLVAVPTDGSSGAGAPSPGSAPGGSPDAGAAAPGSSASQGAGMGVGVGPSASASGSIVVDVAGKVRRPGIATLPLGSRVVDALEAAGGARVGVRLGTLNLARVLVDGEQVVVGLSGPGGVAASAASAPQAAGSAGAGSTTPMVNINSGTQADLEELPGVGPVTAQAILDFRTQQGSFTSVDELLEVSGIGDATLAKIAPYVTL